MPQTPTMTAQQIYDIIFGWSAVPFAEKWEHWRATYNYLPPPPTPYPADEWAMAQKMATLYTGPVRP